MHASSVFPSQSRPLTVNPEIKETSSSFKTRGASFKLLLEFSPEDKGKLGTVAQLLAVKAREIFSLNSSNSVATEMGMFFPPNQWEQIMMVFPLRKGEDISLQLQDDKVKQFHDLCEEHHFKLIKCEIGELFPIDLNAEEKKAEDLQLLSATTTATASQEDMTTPTAESQVTQTTPSIKSQGTVTTPSTEVTSDEPFIVPDVLPNIFQHLSLRDLLRLQRTSRKVQEMLTQDTLWTVRGHLNTYLHINSKQEFMELFLSQIPKEKIKKVFDLSLERAVQAFRTALRPGPEYPCKCCRQAGGMPNSHWYWRCPNLDTPPLHHLGETPRDILAEENRRFERFVAVVKGYLVKGISLVRMTNLGLLSREKGVYSDKTGLKPFVERAVEEGLLYRQGDQGLAEVILLANPVDKLLQILRAKLIEWARTQRVDLGM